MLTKTAPTVPADDERDTFINTRVPAVVRIINASLDEDGDSVVVNGRVDPNTLRFLKVDLDYQRPLGNRPEIYDALKAGTTVPNIDIGVRGQDFDVEGQDLLIRSPAYIIDGWQRVGTAMRLLEDVPNHPLRIFASVHFGTNALWERHRFTELNKNVKKVSPNLHLRNMRDSNDAVLTLFGLSNNTKDFPLYKKVAWSQNMRSGELLSALVLAKTSLRLHAHLSSMATGGVPLIASALAVATHKVSLPLFRKNVQTFFVVIDECFGIRSIELKIGAPQLKTGFLHNLARMFSMHLDFWDDSGKTLFVAADQRRKLSKFPLQDPHIRNLAGSGGAAVNILYEMLVDHMNSGRRTGHLRPRTFSTSRRIAAA